MSMNLVRPYGQLRFYCTGSTTGTELTRVIKYYGFNSKEKNFKASENARLTVTVITVWYLQYTYSILYMYIYVYKCIYITP